VKVKKDMETRFLNDDGEYQITIGVGNKSNFNAGSGRYIYLDDADGPFCLTMSASEAEEIAHTILDMVYELEKEGQQ
jgi:hypothetical protein